MNSNLKIQELTNKKNNMLIPKAEAILRSKGHNSPEYKQALAEIDIVAGDIATLSELSALLPAEERNKAVVPTTVVTAPAISPEEIRANKRAHLNLQFKRFLQGREEFRDIATTNDGSAVVPVEMSEWVTTALKIYAPLTQFARTRFSSNGRSVKRSPLVNDTGNGLFLINEASGTPVTKVDPTISASVTISTDLLSSGQIRYSNQIRDDVDFSLEKFLGTLLSLRTGRGTERLLTRGVDSTGATTPNNPGIISLAQTAVTTSSLSAGPSFDNLVDTFDALDAAYLPTAIWQMTSKTRNTLIKSLDTTNRSLFVPAPNVDGFDMFLGRPIVINQSLDQLTVANGTPIVFGSLYEGLEVVGSEIELVNLKERFADLNESALISFTRWGSAGLTAGALQKVVNASA